MAARFLTCFAARDWDAMAELVADDFSSDDRRAVIGAGIRLGPGAVIEEMRERRPLDHEWDVHRHRDPRQAPWPVASPLFGQRSRTQAFITETLAIGEINADGRIVAFVTFDLDDIDAAFEELDARFLAGEGVAHANTWSVIVAARAALIRHELPPTTPDWVSLDHRRGIAFSPGDFTAYIRALWDQQQDFITYFDAVHQLNDLGAVFTQVAKGPRKKASTPSGGSPNL